MTYGAVGCNVVDRQVRGSRRTQLLECGHRAVAVPRPWVVPVHDPERRPVTYSATGLPSGLTLMASTGYISGTPDQAGSYAVTVTVSDGLLTTTDTFTAMPSSCEACVTASWMLISFMPPSGPAR